MNSYSDEEINQLESKWWEHILPTCQENIDLINEWNMKFSEYQKYLEQVSAFRSWNSEYLIPIIALSFNGDEFLARDILTWAEQKVKEEYMYYCDNLRVANPNNQEQVKLYKTLKSQGCCGFFDDVVDIKGNQVMIGWNFGH